MTAQDKADILRNRWNKANLFTDGQLNTLAWKIPFPHGGNAGDYVQIAQDHWMSLKQGGWSDNECATLMLGGTRAENLLRNS